MLPTGYVLNDTYRVERLLGHGGMAAVYVVSHTRLPRRFALKIIAASLSNQQALLDRFRREAEILASLNHPHVVNVVDWNVYEKQYPYLVMELLEGEDLAHYLHAHGPLTKTQALPIFLQIAEALQAAHAAAIVHRDIKLGNFPLLDLPKFLRGEFRGNTAQLIPKLYWSVNRFFSTESLGLGSKPVAFTVNLVTPSIVCLLAESQDVRLSFRTCNVWH